MQPSTISLARVLELSVPVSWQEAVAVARAVDEVSLMTGIPADPGNCLITTDGAVELNGSRDGHVPTQMATYALLARLLDGRSAPPEVRELVAQHATGADDALMDFLSEEDTSPADKRHLDLGFFARPHPEIEIAALASRSIAAETGQRTDIGRLRETILASTPITVTAAPPAPVHETDMLEEMMSAWWWPFALRSLAAGTIVTVLGMTAVSAWRVLAGSSAPDYSARVEDIPLEPAAAAPSTPMAGSPTGSRPAPGGRSSQASVIPRTTPARAESKPASASSATGIVPGPLAAVTTVEPPVSAPPAAPVAPPVVTAPSAPPPAPPPPSAAREEAAPAGSAGTIYSTADAGIEPPELVRPQLATEVPLDTEPSSSYIEVIVNERGEVARVRLVATDSTLNDRMLVAAAKAWVFRPAIRNGRPVRYLLRVPITR